MFYEVDIGFMIRYFKECEKFSLKNLSSFKPTHSAFKTYS
jgi:hypothetical protein